MITALGILLAGVGVGMVYAGATGQPFTAPILNAFGIDTGNAQGAAGGAGGGDGKGFGYMVPKPNDGKAPGSAFTR